MTTTKKTAAKKAAPTKVVAARPVLPINAPTMLELEGHMREVVAQVERAEAMAPSGICTQHIQLAKVRATLALEIFEGCKQ
jgi:hypothetical protein